MDTPTDPDCYWLEPGRVLAGEYPGSFDTATTRAKLRALLECGIRAFVDLTEEHELEPYEDLLREEAEPLGLTVSYTRLPIRDMDVPDPDRMRAILNTMRRAVNERMPVYVHCWGGVGRTGTVVACWLAERGLAGQDVLEALTRLRQGCAKFRRRSPETPAQAEFVGVWCERALPGERPDGE